MCKDIKLWISDDKKMIALYRENVCVDIFLEKEGKVGKDKALIEYYIGEDLAREEYVNAGEELDFEHILKFLTTGRRP